MSLPCDAETIGTVQRRQLDPHAVLQVVFPDLRRGQRLRLGRSPSTYSYEGVGLSVSPSVTVPPPFAPPKAAAGGNATLAYSLAKQSYGMAKTQEALELMGVSACRLKNVDNARYALGSLSGGRRDSVVSACNQAGVTL